MTGDVADRLAVLSPRHRRFVMAYVRTLNASAAARAIAPTAKRPDQIGYELLRKPEIRAAIDAALAAESMPAAEVLARLTQIARASIADVLRLPDGTPVGQFPVAIDDYAVDLVKAQATGAIHLVKRIKTTEQGTEVEMYSAHEALRDLGKIHRLFIERQELSGPGGEPITVRAEELAAARLAAQQFEQELTEDDASGTP